MLALAVAAAVLAPYVAVGAWLGFGADSLARQAVVTSALIGFLTAAWRYGNRAAAIDLEEMRGLTRCSEGEFAEMVRGRAGSARARLGYPLGAIAIGIAIIPASSEDPSDLLRAESWLRGGVVWFTLANVLLFGLMGRTAYRSRRMAPVPNRIAERIESLDLLDRSRLRPFSRLGLRQAFYWAGGSSIASLLALDLERVAPLFGVLAITLALSTSAFVQPALAIHRRIVREKRLELDRVRERIRRARDGALSGDAEGAAALPGLLAYEARMTAVPEWPFDTGTRLRFAALVVLAIGSWLGGALVERLLGLALGA